jgi:ABC-type transport system substrate-binding protein
VPLDPSYDTNAPFPAFNAADAASLMDTAGYKVDAAGFRTYPGTTKEVSFNVITRGPNAVRTSFLQLIQHDWQTNLKVHVTFSNDPLIFKPWDANGTLYHGTFDVALFAFVTNGDCDSNTGGTQSDQIPSATQKTLQNYTGIKDPTIDSLLAKQRGDTNFTTRVATCKQLYDQLAAQNYFEPLYIRANVTAAKTTMQNYYPHPTLAGNQWNLADWGTTKKSS